MAACQEIPSSPSCEISRQTNNDNDSKMSKSTSLYFSEDNLLWKGDLESLKQFIEAELQISGRWSSPRGETIQFSNPELCLKWHGQTEQKISIVQDNEEKELYAALKGYAASTESTDNEKQQNITEHMVLAEGETNQDTNTEDKHSCGQCDFYKDEIAKLLTIVNEIQKKQNEDRQNNLSKSAETDAKLKSLVERNDKMAAEIASLQASVEETTGDNKIIRHALDIKQNEWTKANSKNTSDKGKKPQTVKNSIKCQNQFEALTEDSTNHGTNTISTQEATVERNKKDGASQQMTHYRARQRKRFQDTKNGENQKKTKREVSPNTKCLVIGDSMVKNINSRKLERAARSKTICHSYSGATVGQIKEKVESYWNEDQHYEKVILHVGTNDLAREEPTEVAKNMETLIEKVKAHTKEVAVSSVIKRYDNRIRASKITQYNSLLHELCIKHKIVYVNNDCIDKVLLNGSNLHLNRCGDRALGSAFCTYLKQRNTPIKSRNQEGFFHQAHWQQTIDQTMHHRYVSLV